MSVVGVIDFETTGLSPAMGDRATEVAIVLLDGAQVVGRFQSLMNAGVRISPFIEQYTGISNEMIRAAPPAEDVMAEAARFVRGVPLVAHNASFDQRFWSAELDRLGPDASRDHPFACTMLLSRRLYPQAGSYRLQSLASFHALPPAGRAHRAMADAEVAAALLSRIRQDIQREYEVDAAPHALLVRLQRTQRKALPKAIQAYFSSALPASRQPDHENGA
ncbi:3'-5' exonuclease [Ramlibacter sp. USB13]|uniref:3'-5' exonuclease n=1 Tax=Ramlibacter cellulosilyticus TaxID=2764187 RepID=A0A923MQB6_9BURK|nr:3'-5' exonuclease [Ramlibacter cellulosilyticus]MBC5782624.1 3'-5' exonuclease [Ramlibacter cellulosilyticus]